MVQLLYTFSVRKTVAERFWSKVDVRHLDECWEWTRGRFPGGYGQFKVTPRQSPWKASRVAWLLAYEDPEDLCVLHRCDNPPCCNPAHLFLGTPADNTADMIAKGRNRQYGRHLSQEGTLRISEARRKVTDAQLAEVRMRRGSGESLRSIAKSMGVAHTTVSRALRGKTLYSNEA